MVFGICQFMSLEMKWTRRPPGSSCSVFSALCLPKHVLAKSKRRCFLKMLPLDGSIKGSA